MKLLTKMLTLINAPAWAKIRRFRKCTNTLDNNKSDSKVWEHRAETEEQGAGLLASAVANKISSVDRSEIMIQGMAS